MVALSRGTEILHDGVKYKIEGVLAIDALTTVYAVSGEGPCQLITVGVNQPNDIEIVPFEDEFDPLLEVIPLFHYSLDWSTGLVRGKLIWGITLKPAPGTNSARYLVFGPYYISTITDADMDSVSRDYHMVSKSDDIDQATEKIHEALLDKREFFLKKVESYDGVLGKVTPDEEIRF